MNRQIRVGYLVTGLIFLGVAASWLLRENDVIEGTRWLVPAVLLGAGVVGLAGSLLGNYRKDTPMASAGSAHKADDQPAASGDQPASATIESEPDHD